MAPKRKASNKKSQATQPTITEHALPLPKKPMEAVPQGALRQVPWQGRRARGQRRSEAARRLTVCALRLGDVRGRGGRAGSRPCARNQSAVRGPGYLAGRVFIRGPQPVVRGSEPPQRAQPAVSHESGVAAASSQPCELLGAEPAVRSDPRKKR